ncbi:HNH endonuclease signature motif containing protein [Mycolicibacterium houstonense]|uniref:HNH endonuclease signature motif containing protein n=1 Tax=Mycolicibacterium houstonense TaxID=146021 RepID=UPI000829FFF8|nr:HNH endonuclease signature motif containing protein [Mycolicibacterium houstonense]
MSQRVSITDYNGVALDYSHNEFLNAFLTLPLPVRMRFAADTLAAVNDRHHYGTIEMYVPKQLLAMADRWEAEDRAKADRESEVEKLAEVLHHVRERMAGAGAWDRRYARAVLVRLDNVSYGVHVIVAMAWHGPCPDGMEVDHINEVRNDNRPENLRYLTKAENLARRVWNLAEECVHGHKLAGDNLYVRPGGRRECRACNRSRAAGFRSRAEECSVYGCDTRGEAGTREKPLCQTHYRHLRRAS